MRPSAASFARGVAMAIVLILAAIAGLVVGNALDGRDGGNISLGAGADQPQRGSNVTAPTLR